VTESWQELYDEAPCGYLTTRSDGTIVNVNATFLAITGYTREELLDRTRFFRLLAPGDRIFYETHYLPLLLIQGHVREIAVTLVCADGTRRPVLINAALKRADSGDLIRTAVFIAEDRRTYEGELLEARRRAEESESRVRILAETLQASLLPPALPSIRGMEIAAVYRPAGRGDEVGGDFYDVFETRADDWTIVLGDVCGKGASAATLTSLVRHTVRALALHARKPRTLLAALNRSLLAERARPSAMWFTTVACARLQLRAKDGVRLTVALGGHPHPFLLRNGVEPIPLGRRGTVMGAVPEPRLHDVVTVLEPGDAVVLYTDGVTEARRDNEFFGEARLEGLLANLTGKSATDIAQGLSDAVLDFQRRVASDDIAVVVLRVPEAAA
jgi:sigma-B regulation protein RsbU (phosphoserine phosphatase)